MFLVLVFTVFLRNEIHFTELLALKLHTKQKCQVKCHFSNNYYYFLFFPPVLFSGLFHDDDVVFCCYSIHFSFGYRLNIQSIGVCIVNGRSAVFSSLSFLYICSSQNEFICTLQRPKFKRLNFFWYFFLFFFKVNNNTHKEIGPTKENWIKKTPYLNEILI